MTESHNISFVSKNYVNGKILTTLIVTTTSCVNLNELISELD